MRSDSGTGSGLSRTLWTTENSAVLAPMHKASVSAAVSEKALSFHTSRRPTRMSLCMMHIDGERRGDVRWRDGRDHSILRDCEGLTLDALQAGTALATAETLSSTADATSHDTGSLARTP